MVRGLADLSDAQANVMKTTGLTQKEVEGLGETLKTFDTRTSRKELLSLAEIAGKLGIRGKENIEGFVKAADQLAVALGEDLGGNAKDAITAVGKLSEIFKVEKEFGTEQALLKIGSAINSLGSASTANEGYLVDFAKRLGGIAPSSKISIDQILGLGATMDQLGQSSETSATALGQLLVALAQDTPAFAKLAGKSIKDFSDMLATDANGALIAVLEGAKSTQGGLAGMATTLQKLGIDGARSASVVGVLSNNIELLKNQQALSNKEFEAGTSLTNEFNVKNQTLAAVIEKIQKRLAGMFINSTFMKGLQDVLILFEQFIKANQDLSDGLREQEKALIATSTQFNAEMKVLMNGNLTTEQRNGLIAQMNREYKDFLPSLITEKTTQQELTEIQKQGNAVLMEKIILKAREADLTEKLNNIVQLEKQQELDRVRIVQAQVEAEKAAAGTMERAANSMSGVDWKLESANQAVSSIDAAIKAREREIEAIQKTIEMEEGLFDRILKRKGLTASKGDTKFTLSKDPTSKPTRTASTDINAGAAEITIPEDKKAKASAASDIQFDDTIEKWKEFNAKILKISDERWIEEDKGTAKEFEAINLKYEALLNEADTFRAKEMVSVADYLQMVADINKLHSDEIVAKAKEVNAKLAEENKAKNEKIIADDNEFWAKESDMRLAALEKAEDDREKDLAKQAQYYSQLGSLLGEFSSVLSATNSLISSMGAEQGEFQKQLALFNIGVDMAASMAKAISAALSAGAMTGPAAPLTTPIFVAQMVGIVITSFAKAHALLNKDAPSPPTFAGGGFTGPGTYTDATGHRVAGLAHDNEYVVPKNLLFKNPWVANQVAIIEAIRVGRSPDVAYQPSTSQGPMQSANAGDSGSAAVMGAMLREFAGLRADVRALDKPYRAFYTTDEVDAASEYERKNKQNNSISRL
jgi:TP901 family phage tail tape measure protein